MADLRTDWLWFVVIGKDVGITQFSVCKLLYYISIYNADDLDDYDCWIMTTMLLVDSGRFYSSLGTGISGGLSSASIAAARARASASEDGEFE